MKASLILLSLSALVALSACSDEKVAPQKSPCVGIDNSPCGPKRQVNKDLVLDSHSLVIHAKA